MVSRLVHGNIALVLCAIFYLIWWILAFEPGKGQQRVTWFWLLPTAFFGIAAVVMLIRGIQVKVDCPVPNLGIVIGGGVSYLILLFLTSRLAHRIVTTELVLIVGWVMLELCVINTALGLDKLSESIALLMAVLIIIAGIASMVAYMAYYNMGEQMAYIDGMIPLILTGAISAVLAALI